MVVFGPTLSTPGPLLRGVICNGVTHLYSYKKGWVPPFRKGSGKAIAAMELWFATVDKPSTFPQK